VAKSNLKWLILDKLDLSIVHELESQSSLNPWSKKSLEASLGSNHISLGLYNATKLVGFIILQIVLDELEILNICVSKQKQRQGIGSLLMDEIFRLCQEKQIQQITLEVRESNIIAQSLYLKYGFEILAVRKDYYKNNTENAIIMRHSIK